MNHGTLVPAIFTKFQFILQCNHWRLKCVSVAFRLDRDHRSSLQRFLHFLSFVVTENARIYLLGYINLLSRSTWLFYISNFSRIVYHFFVHYRFTGRVCALRYDAKKRVSSELSHTTAPKSWFFPPPAVHFRSYFTLDEAHSQFHRRRNLLRKLTWFTLNVSTFQGTPNSPSASVFVKKTGVCVCVCVCVYVCVRERERERER